MKYDSHKFQVVHRPKPQLPHVAADVVLGAEWVATNTKHLHKHLRMAHSHGKHVVCAAEIMRVHFSSSFAYSRYTTNIISAPTNPLVPSDDDGHRTNNCRCCCHSLLLPAVRSYGPRPTATTTNHVSTSAHAPHRQAAVPAGPEESLRSGTQRGRPHSVRGGRLSATQNVQMVVQQHRRIARHAAEWIREALTASVQADLHPD